jgi:hypothetical protein
VTQDYTLPADRYLSMSDDEKSAADDWIREHDLDPGDVPLGAEILLDEAFNEFSFPVYPRINGVHFVREDGEVAQVRIRRVVKSLPPWALEAVPA